MTTVKISYNLDFAGYCKTRLPMVVMKMFVHVDDEITACAKQICPLDVTV